MNLSNRIKKRRLDLQLSQTEAANRAGIKQQSWASLESGTTKFPRNLHGIAKALECSAEWLMNGGILVEEKAITPSVIPIFNGFDKLTTDFKEKIQNPDFSNEFILSERTDTKSLVAFRITDESMEPAFQKGDIVIIDTSTKPAPGEFIVASDFDKAFLFRKFRELDNIPPHNDGYSLIPLNSDFPVVTVIDQMTKIIGTMVEQRIYRKRR
ncbi:LexA family transcriptional regulator [Erwiniaceae bacterium L1_55_4]|nr:LexA family transcriptional regulator [Erwiniaceae bacterium L1_55_4]